MKLKEYGKLFKINKTPIIILLIASVVVAGFFPFCHSTPVFADSSVLTYSESTDEIVNPAAGFYKAITATLKRGVSDAPVSESTIEYYSQDFGLYHLLFDIADFSSNAGGVDAEIDADALSAIKKVFGFLRKHKVGAIVRFDYNRGGNKGADGKYLNAEPSLELVLKHIQNVSSVISEYSDVILGVESGMLGPWGEQHSTTLASSGAHTYYMLVETWLDNTPETTGITVRRPLYFTYWANEKFNLNLNVSALADFDTSLYPSAERVGVYNDGYLGSSSDLGTFTDREAETAFIGKQAERTYYGGELVADSQTGLLGDYNSVDYLEREGFVTHTSYLNIDWNDSVINEYANRTYNGANELYRGKTTEFTFLKNRLGYRFYLSESYAPLTNDDGSVKLKFTVANAGFARILCPSRSELVFTDGKSEETAECDVDLSQIPSDGAKTFEITASVPERFSALGYDVYLRFYTEYGAEIRFANDKSVCAPDRQGVKIASTKKSEPVKTLVGIAVTSQPAKTTYTVGDAIDLAGLEVTATYSDGTTVSVTVTSSILSGFDTESAGTKTVTVTFGDKTATFDVLVNAAQENNPPQNPSDGNSTSKVIKTVIICVAAAIVVFCLTLGLVLYYRKRKR